MARASPTSAFASVGPVQRERFLAAHGERGPHPIPRAQEISRPFHRLFSVKAGCRPVLCPSALLADAVLMAEGDPDVTALTEHPLRIQGPLGHRPHVTFDLELTRRSDGAVLYAVVHDATLELAPDGRRLPRHWPEIEAWCERHGHVCAVLTDHDVDRHRTRIANWRMLLPFVRLAREAPDPVLRDRVAALLESQPRLSAAGLLDYLPPTDEEALIGAIATLLHEGEADAMLDTRAFTRQTPIRRRERHA